MDAKGFISKALPWIGAAATGGIPALAGMAAAKVSSILGKPVGSTADAIAGAVAGATPEQILALKQADNEFAQTMQKLGFDHAEALVKMADDDRANARAREVAVRDWTPRVLAYLVVGMVIMGEGWLMLHGTPPGADGVIIGRVLGTLDSALIIVLQYYFGRSSDSDRKTEIIANATPAPMHSAANATPPPGSTGNQPAAVQTVTVDTAKTA